MIDAYMNELAAALRVRGSVRRRFLRECRDHLADAAGERGEAEAIRAFGPAAEIAAAFDLEVATRRGVRSTFAGVAGLLATGGSTLALVLRRSTPPPEQLTLLARRNGCALAAAGLTMFAAGAAVPGQGSAPLLLAGPLLVCVASVAVLRARALARRLEGAGARAVRPPLEDVARLTRLRLPALDATRLLMLTICVAAAAAFVRDRAEHATPGQALVTAGIEGLAVVGCFLTLGPALGLWRRRSAT